MLPEKAIDVQYEARIDIQDAEILKEPVLSDDTIKQGQLSADRYLLQGCSAVLKYFDLYYHPSHCNRLLYFVFDKYQSSLYFHHLRRYSLY
jgi:hypothetical protein